MIITEKESLHATKKFNDETQIEPPKYDTEITNLEGSGMQIKSS